MSTILEWKVKQLVDRTAISDWLPYEAWDDTNQVYRLDDGRIGVVFSSKPLLGLSEESIQKLTNLFESDLPIGITFQFMLHASPIIEPYLDNHVILAQRGQAGERYVADARKTAEFYLHARDTQLTSNPPLRPRDFTVYVSVAFPTQETTAQGWEDERIHQAVSVIESLACVAQSGPQLGESAAGVQRPTADTRSGGPSRYEGDASHQDD